MPPPPASLQGDASLLAALAAEVLLPGARVGVPEDLAVELAGGAPATAPKSAAPVGQRCCYYHPLLHVCGGSDTRSAAWRAAGLPRFNRPNGGSCRRSMGPLVSVCLAAAAAGGSAKPSGPGRPRFERPTDLLPDLLRLVQAEPTLQKGKVRLP